MNLKRLRRVRSPRADESPLCPMSTLRAAKAVLHEPRTVLTSEAIVAEATCLRNDEEIYRRYL